MNQVSEKSKTGAIKTLAIIGFVSMIVLVVWLFIQVIRVVPTAFSSLASLADNVYNNRPVNTLNVALEKSIVNVGDDFQMSWTDLNREGIYTFNYECVDGVSVDIRTGAGVNAVPCDHDLALPSTTHGMDMLISSEKQRFTDVPFTLAFTEVNEIEPLFVREGKVTIINAAIPQNIDLTDEEPTRGNTVTKADTDRNEQPTGSVAGETTTTIPKKETPAVVKPKPVTPAVTTPAPKTPVKTTYSYIPVSYENGFTDLKVTFLGIGTMDGSAFVPAGSIDKDEKGAFRFEVKNIGTKTSEPWSFDATLPSGQKFDSKTQTALKPNERAVFTLGFEHVGDTGAQDIEVEVSAENDTNTKNNEFDWTVAVTD